MMRFFLAVAVMLTLSGCLWPGVTPPQTLHYCCGTLPLTLQQDNVRRQVRLVLDGNALTLSQTSGRHPPPLWVNLYGKSSAPPARRRTGERRRLRL
ncbi:hypothetical protein [Edwardsiella ictaluri]|uniref:hypothetical protein n=1 Tax=Edwardsiella ictaluri TaxID=67780 RepID=UPI001E3C6599|nr:hypothetical protein [Edwardsiella ictaluri]